MTIAESLKRFRRDFRLSQKEVAAKVGMVPQAYYRYETGKYIPQSDVIVTLAKAYDVTTDYLLGVTDTPRAKPPPADSKLLLDALLNCRDVIQSALDNQIKGT